MKRIVFALVLALIAFGMAALTVTFFQLRGLR